MKLRKLTALLLTGVMTMALFAGCSKTAEEGTQEPSSADAGKESTVDDTEGNENGGVLEVGEEEISLKVMTWQYEDAEVAALQETIALFNEKYPNVTIDLVTVQDYLTEYKLAFDANEGPDLVYVDDTTQVLLERYDYLLDLTEYVEAYGWADICTQGILEYQNARHEGQYYSVAMNSNPRVFWYNKAIFEELDLEVPETLEELDAACEVIKAAGYVPFESDPTALLWMIGELVFDYTPYDDVKDWYYLENTSDAMTKGWLQAMEKIAEWVEKGYFREEILSLDTTNAFAQFAGGSSAMFYCSGNISGYFGIYAEGFDVGAFRFPTLESGEEKVVVSGAHSGWAVNSAIEEDKLAAALAFLDNFYTEAVNDVWVAAGYFSALDFDIADVEADDAYLAVVDAIQNTKIGFFLDNAETGLLDEMVTLNQELLLGDITAQEYCDRLNSVYEELKPEQAAE